MSVTLMAQVLYRTVGADHRPDAKRPVSARLRKLVLLKLCDNANDDGSAAYPSAATLAAAGECNERSAREALYSLRFDGLIALTAQPRPGGPDGGAKPAEWTVDVDALWSLPLPEGTEGFRRFSDDDRLSYSVVSDADSLSSDADSLHGATRTVLSDEPSLNRPYEPRRRTSNSYSNPRRDDIAPTVISGLLPHLDDSPEFKLSSEEQTAGKRRVSALREAMHRRDNQ